MAEPPIRVGIIGTGFGQTVQVPGFRQLPNVEVVAICSGRMARAEAAAHTLAIPHAFDDYRAMLAQTNLDLVSIVTPVYLHRQMALDALDAGCHVLCEKPMALDQREAREMLDRARAAGRIHMIDHELRFNPTRARIAELLASGYIGRVYHANIRSVSGLRAGPNRLWDWWSQREKGGGALGASGSHQIDLLRWWLGEIVSVSGQLETFVRERPNANGQPTPVDSDDQFSFTARLASGAYAHVFSSSVVRYGGSNQVEIHGDSGSLVLDNDDRLWGQRAGEAEPTELTVDDPAATIPGIGPTVWARSFVHLARALSTSIRSGQALQRGATFEDGWRCQVALDALRQSWAQRRWVDVAPSE
ncbi:MAG: Gfo/Idh/MocA family oxidoreductase [Chloroflexales bacterium]|nr:Gfo/Idh/MocA family oxidoreductase [Chloroflexales bacterium]